MLLNRPFEMVNFVLREFYLNCKKGVRKERKPSWRKVYPWGLDFFCPEHFPTKIK